MYLVLLGPPGAGKGTQALTLSKELGVEHVASGDLFRYNLNKKTPLGLKAKAYMDRGDLVPDDLTVQMVLQKLKSPEIHQEALLDGFPRTINQAKSLDEALCQEGTSIDIVLFLKVSREKVIQRLSGRWICQDCQSPYHTFNAPPISPGRCDSCKGALYQRPDDTEETAANRFGVYMKQTSPLIDHYYDQGKLIEINGEQAVDQVGHDMLKSLSRIEKERSIR